MKCTCQHHQSKTKRKDDYHLTRALVNRSEWYNLSPEDKAEIEFSQIRQRELAERLSKMTYAERIEYAREAFKENMSLVGKLISEGLKSKQMVE